MTRQKSDGRVVPQALRKVGPTRSLHLGGGKATTVSKGMLQLELRLGTAEDPAAQAMGADDRADTGRPVPARLAAPKPGSKLGQAVSPTMEAVAEHVEEAFERVVSNRGAPGPDRQTVEAVRVHWPELRAELQEALRRGTYQPGNIRRVWIPKSGGGQRGLGIPDVIDRVVQEAVRRVLEPRYEPQFHPSSHGFRVGRSCQTAIAEAVEHVEAGFGWVVDLDVEQFFDRVNHQRLMARLAERVQDRALLKLIGRMLKAKVVLPEGVVVSREEGVPQGGPLSPLLSNIVLDELDQELARRGHRFVRYADDCNIYVRSERAGQRVMASVVRFIERRLRLKVNGAKSAVAQPEERHFLGFRLKRKPMTGDVEVLLSKRSIKRLEDVIRERTPRTWGQPLRACIEGLNTHFRGWMEYFGICTAGVETVLMRQDEHTRRRLRAIQLRHWKRRTTRAKQLVRLGVKRGTAWRSVYEGKRSTWALSNTSAVNRGLCNAYFAERRLVSLKELWRKNFERIAALGQQMTLNWG